MSTKLSDKISMGLSTYGSSDKISGESSTTASSLPHSQLQEGTSKNDPTMVKVLEVIRDHFPIMTLFDPELKIDLRVFIKDQLLIRRIVEFISPLLLTTTPVNSDLIAKSFDKSSLLVEIKNLFKQDPSPYLSFLYEACSDVLNKKTFSKDHLKPAIEGRIFTLKNALIAQYSPESLSKTQLHHQPVSSIREEGASFIRTCLSLHSLERSEGSSFKEGLISVAEQLTPFVRTITKIYLRENREDCTEDPLTYRNPTGYNHHGLTAATIMEVCLHILGYTTQVKVRSDLEPKVTLATAHSVVEVTAPDTSRYLVDPCHMQFSKDFCMDEGSLPKSSVLVLSEAEIDRYIDENLMVHWKANAERVKKGVQPVIQKLYQQDKLTAFLPLMPFEIQQLKIPPEFIPQNPEEWVRSSLKRVWGLRTYSPILSNLGFQQIFVGTTPSKTHEYIQAMGIGSLSHHMAFEEVERRLKEMLHIPNLKHQNAPEALSLIAQLPSLSKPKYTSLLDLDPRIKVIGELLNTYFRALKKIVNPDGKDISVLYGCSGGDCISVLLATDARDCIFVDLTPISYQEFEEALAQLNPKDPLSLESSFFEMALRPKLEQSNGFISVQLAQGGASSAFCEGKHEMKDLALKFFYNLRAMGVDLTQVTLSSNQEGKIVRIDFPWQYYGASSSRKRSITFISADITTPHAYPPLLKAQLEKGLDIFYMKASFLVPRYYPQFLPYIGKAIKEGGWLMTADKTFMMEDVLPEKCLGQSDLRFLLQGSDETRIMEHLLSVPFDPLSTISFLKIYPQELRYMRNSGSDATYWAIVNLRKKAT